MHMYVLNLVVMAKSMYIHTYMYVHRIAEFPLSLVKWPASFSYGIDSFEINVVHYVVMR